MIMERLGVELSPRLLQVFDLVAASSMVTQGAMAYELWLSKDTVRVHIREINSRLEATNYRIVYERPAMVLRKVRGINGN